MWTHMDADFYTPFSHFGIFVTISTENESVKVYLYHGISKGRSWLVNHLLRTIGDTILMQVKPWFSHEVGKDFRKRENGGGKYYLDFGEEVV